MAASPHIPSGSWTLWFHNPEDSKWTLSSFTKVATFSTWHDFWQIADGLLNSKKDSTDAFGEGMFFLMRDNIPPLWENSANIRGGGYSFRVQRREASDLYLVYCIAAMLEEVMNTPLNKVNGVSISPKKNFNIIKIWNTNAETFNKITDIKTIVKDLKVDDFMYTPFHQKHM